MIDKGHTMNFEQMTDDELKSYVKEQTKIAHLNDKRQGALKVCL